MTPIYKRWKKLLDVYNKNSRLLRENPQMSGPNNLMKRLLYNSVVFDLRPVEDLVMETAKTLVAKQDALYDVYANDETSTIKDEQTVWINTENLGDEYFISHGGLFVMPAEQIWLEFTMLGKHPVAIVMKQVESNREGSEFILFEFFADDDFVKAELFVELRGDGFRVALEKESNTAQVAQALALAAIAGLLIINAPYGIKKQTTPVHKGHAREAKKQGFTLYPQHTITLDKTKPPPEYANGRKTDIKKAFHFVRSHRRRFNDGSSTIVKAHWRGDPRLGIHRQPDYKVK